MNLYLHLLGVEKSFFLDTRYLLFHYNQSSFFRTLHVTRISIHKHHQQMYFPHTGEAAEFKSCCYMLRTRCCRTDRVVYIKLCYVEHNTVSPAASGLQHVTTTFKFCCFPSVQIITMLSRDQRRKCVFIQYKISVLLLSIHFCHRTKSLTCRESCDCDGL